MQGTGPRASDEGGEIELFGQERWQQVGNALGLTSRQTQIADLMCRGCTYKAIAARAGISVNTVRMHVRSLYQRLGAHDRTSVMLHVIETERSLPRDDGSPRADA